MFGLRCNKGYYLFKGTSPAAQAKESRGWEPSCYSSRAAEGASMTRGFSSSGALLFLATATKAGVFQ